MGLYPCIPYAVFVRLCVECNQHPRPCLAKRLRVAVGPVERPSEAEWARAANSSAPVRPSGLERRSRPPQRGRAGSSGQLERPSVAERARAANSTARGGPSVFVHPSQSGRAGSHDQFRAPQRRQAGPSSQFEVRFPQRYPAGSKPETSPGVVFSAARPTS